MSLKEILQQCPKSAGKFYQWIHQHLRNIQVLHEKSISEDMEMVIPEIEKEFVELFAESTLSTNWRSLFSFFDQEGVVMEIGVDRTSDPKFCYSFNTSNSDLFYTRPEAEIEGFVQAFKLLEEKLNKQ